MKESSGSVALADGRLTDLIRRVSTFGMVLMKLDIRQEASRHTEAMDEITKAIEAGSYAEWDEPKRLDFLVKELKNKRPIVPYKFEVCYFPSFYYNRLITVENIEYFF